ncbi:MAG: hypothetical protein CK424_01810 [Legionella sp.]|nr:MAG: hypothetical protein CK424_01810 [Legionella sp.]
MSVNKTVLQAEGLDDNKTTNAYLTHLESQQADCLSLCNKLKQESAENYLKRDDAFFKYLQSIRQLKSEVLLLGQFTQPTAIPDLPNCNATITSLIERYDHRQTDFLANIEQYRQAKKEYSIEYDRLTGLISGIETSIQSIIVPQILYFFLQYFPSIITIYRYFYPNNHLDEAIELGAELVAKYDEYTDELDQLHTAFEKQWQNTQDRYERINDHQVKNLRKNKADYEKLSHKLETLNNTLQSYDHPELKESYAQFQKNPTYTTLFELVRQMTHYEYKAKMTQKENTTSLHATLMTLQELYPEVSEALDSFHTEILSQLSATEMLTILGKRGHTIFEENKILAEKIAKAHELRNLSVREKSKLVPILDYPTIQNIDERIKKIDNYLEKETPILNNRIKFTNLLGAFWKTRSGENLKNLYEFCTLSQADSYQKDTARYLKSLYPESIKQLELEQKKTMFRFPNDIAYNLRVKYLKELITLRDSTEPDEMRHKALAISLLDFIREPTWGNFNRMEQALQHNPSYYTEKPQLALLVKELMSVILTAQELQVKVVKKPVIESEELLINQDNPRPNFFQPTPKQEKKINRLCRDMLELINQHTTEYRDGTASDDAKQDIIMNVMSHITSYIEVLSKPDSLSSNYHHLFKDIATFLITLTTDHEKDFALNENMFTEMQTKLEQLDHNHPIRKAVEFLIETARSKEAYIAVDTTAAKTRFKEEFEQIVATQEKQLIKARATMDPNKEKLRRVLNIREIVRLLEDYTKKLERYPSNHNQAEHRALRAFLKDFNVETTIESLSKLTSSEEQANVYVGFYNKIKPTLLALTTHPALSAIKQCLLELKEVKELSSTPGTTSTPKSK